MKRRDLFVGAAALAAAGLRTAQAQTPRTRKNLLTLSADDPFFTDYGDAIRRMHQLSANDRRNWRQQALIHANYCPHGDPNFLAWHRHYILAFEEICGALINKPSFALPYWDWTINNGRLPAPFFADGPLNVTFWNDPSNHSSPSWGGQIQTTARRGIGPTSGLGDDPIRGGAFTPTAITNILRNTNFSIFMRQLEGSPHNNGHVIAGAGGGHMGNGLSSLDPIFWLHHCNVDRLWAEWQTAGNQMPSMTQAYNGQFADKSGNSKNVTAAQATNFQALGYTYDIFTSTPAGNDAAVVAAAPTTGAGLLSASPPPAAAPALLGRSVANLESVPNVVSPVGVKASNLLAALSGSRVFRPTEFAAIKPRTALERARIVAKITVNKGDGRDSDVVVNAFVNCPYLSPETRYTDPHYAGTFSFFGANESGSREFYVDISQPLWEQAETGRLASEDVNVQLLPVSASQDVVAKTRFTIESVELLRL